MPILRKTKLTLLLAVIAQTSSSVESAEDETRFLDLSRSASQALIKQLGQSLKAAMSQNGPASAISVCKNIAPGLANKLSVENGLQMVRVSERPRNPMLGLPDSWEQQTMIDFAKRLSAGEVFDSLERYEVVDEPLGQFFRYAKPLETKAICLVCHGTESQIPAEVRTQIQTQYPHDRATSFKLGEIRGLISVKQAVKTVPLKLEQAQK